MELTAEAARRLIDETVAQLGEMPEAAQFLAVCNRLQGMYELLKVIPSFKASRYHPRMFPEAVEVEEMLVEAIEEVQRRQAQAIAGQPDGSQGQLQPARSGLSAST